MTLSSYGNVESEGAGGTRGSIYPLSKSKEPRFHVPTVGLCVVADSNYDGLWSRTDAQCSYFLFSSATIQDAFMLCILQFREFSGDEKVRFLPREGAQMNKDSCM